MILNNIFKLKTRDIMATNVLKVAPDTPLSEVFTSMMRKNRQEALIIERVEMCIRDREGGGGSAHYSKGHIQGTKRVYCALSQ